MSNFHNNSNLLLNNSTHPIIQQKNTFSLDRKLLTVHAIDRDILFYPISNLFSIKTPQSYNNVQSLRLTEISFPGKINNFSNKLNNNIFNISTYGQIIIPDGNYTEIELATFLTNQLNNITVQYLSDRQRFIFYSNNPFNINYYLPSSHCNQFTPINNSFRNQSRRSNNFIDAFNINQVEYDVLFINEGFLYDIGFDISVNTINFQTNISTQYGNLSRISSLLQDNSKNYILTNSLPRFRDKQAIYMEIDSLNVNFDELNPFPNGTNNMFSNSSNSSTRTAFIKIPYYIFNNGGILYDNVQNGVAFFETPIKRIQNFKFKFRYHDNMLVDLDNQDINFTLEINQLRSNIHRDMKVMTPIL